MKVAISTLSDWTNELTWLAEAKRHPECDARPEEERTPTDYDDAERLLAKVNAAYPENADELPGDAELDVGITEEDADRIVELTGVWLG